jgi:cysteine desulfurase/selenocysteine lyase
MQEKKNGFIYLDNSATTYPKPPEVYSFMDKFYRETGVSPGRSGYDMCLESEMVVSSTRKMLTELFNGTNPDRLVFSYNASEALNMIFDGLLQKGDHVITTSLEHNSVLRPLYHRETDGLIEVSYLSFDNSGFIDPTDISKAIRKNTRMVVLNHASNVIGTVQPAREVGRICREAGLIFVLDTSQSAGIVDIDMQEMNIDVLAFTGHKCLMGPTGIGGLCVSEELDIKPSKFGGTGVRSAQRTHLEEYPYRLECGTLNILGIAGLYAGQKWLRKVGMANIHKREMILWNRLRKELQNIDGVKTYCADSPDNHIAVLSFNIDGFDAGDVGTMLDVDYDIATRTGLQCAPLVHASLGTESIHGTVRFGIGPFNTDEHIEKAIGAVREIASIKRKS